MFSKAMSTFRFHFTLTNCYDSSRFFLAAKEVCILSIHLHLLHVGVKPLQPHAASFHPHQPLVVVTVGTYIIEFDASTGSKISALNIGAPAVRMSYSPTCGHTVIAILQSFKMADTRMEETLKILQKLEKLETRFQRLEKLV
ncbi:hypothetical protein VNO77_40821 [Canavalia gladiata]|uniref:Uncharacterized protein n=1 Tax=Canavalia gladiata TaxID=3824 RepID=A0AAN9PRR1_CANGL